MMGNFVKSYAIGAFGLRLNVVIRDKRTLLDLVLTPAQHYAMARDHVRAADEMLKMGLGPHDEPVV
jgi:hypothetical protein